MWISGKARLCRWQPKIATMFSELDDASVDLTYRAAPCGLGLSVRDCKINVN